MERVIVPVATMAVPFGAGIVVLGAGYKNSTIGHWLIILGAIVALFGAISCLWEVLAIRTKERTEEEKQAKRDKTLEDTLSELREFRQFVMGGGKDERKDNPDGTGQSHS